MRIADLMSFEQVRKNVGDNRTQMNHLQNQAATQKRVTKPSDDPVAASRVLTEKVDLSGTDQYAKNLNYARSFLELTDQSLDELTQALVRAKELLISQSNDASANKRTRRVVATEVDQLFNQMVKVGNRKLADRFIFGGFKTTKAPFSAQGEYLGDSGEMQVGVDKESYLIMNMPGSKVFLGEGLSADGVTKGTPQQARNIEEFRDQMGVPDQPEPQATPREELGVSLRGPASVETPQENPPGEVAEESAGPVKDHQGIDLFNILKKVSIALKTDDKVAVQNSLEDVDEAIAQVVLARSQVGARASMLDSTLESLNKTKVDTNINITNLEDVDAFKVVSDINKTESTLQATLQTSGKMIQKSLMDFIS